MRVDMPIQMSLSVSKSMVAAGLLSSVSLASPSLAREINLIVCEESSVSPNVAAMLLNDKLTNPRVSAQSAVDEKGTGKVTLAIRAPFKVSAPTSVTTRSGTAREEYSTCVTVTGESD
jgi:hypothetical protein